MVSVNAAIKTAELPIDLPLQAVAELCRKWRICRLEIFGAALRPDFSAASDIDLLYTFHDSAHIGWDIVSVAEDFERLLHRPVDMVSREAVARSTNWIRRRNILSSTLTIYAE